MTSSLSYKILDLSGSWIKCMDVIRQGRTMFPDVKVRSYDYIDPTRLSSPTCEQLGIPNEQRSSAVGHIQNPSLHIDGIRYEARSNTKRDPFSAYSMIPLPSPFGLNIFEPTCIRRRNERERDRVKCVNDGYLKLKAHLPIENKDKRISKVETLRTAIQYIKHLERVLADSDDGTPSQRSVKSEQRDVTHSVIHTSGYSEEDSDFLTDISDNESKLGLSSDTDGSDGETFIQTQPRRNTVTKDHV